jgi:hypothetical protein
LIDGVTRRSLVGGNAQADDGRPSSSSLREQLKRLGFRSEEVLEGQALDQLSADEVYVLAKTLPNFSLSPICRRRARLPSRSMSFGVTTGTPRPTIWSKRLRSKSATPLLRKLRIPCYGHISTWLTR